MKKLTTILALLISCNLFSQSPPITDGFTQIEVINPLKIKITNEQSISTAYNVRMPDTSNFLTSTVLPGGSVEVELDRCGKGNAIPIASPAAAKIGVEYSSCYEVLAVTPTIDYQESKDHKSVLLRAANIVSGKTYHVDLHLKSGKVISVAFPLNDKRGDYYFYTYKIQL